MAIDIIQMEFRAFSLLLIGKFGLLGPGRPIGTQKYPSLCLKNKGKELTIHQSLLSQTEMARSDSASF